MDPSYGTDTGGRKRIETVVGMRMSELESLLFTYGLEYPKVVHKGTDPQGWDVSDWGPQNRRDSTESTQATRLPSATNDEKKGCRRTPQELLADVLLACENVRLAILNWLILPIFALTFWRS